MHIFKTKWLARFTKREEITSRGLIDAIERAERGLIDADLGGGLIKQRVARAGGGKSGGYRMIVAFRAKHRAVFLYGFAKSERANIDRDELESLREIGASWLAASAEKVSRALQDQVLELINDDEKED